MSKIILKSYKKTAEIRRVKMIRQKKQLGSRYGYANEFGMKWNPYAGNGSNWWWFRLRCDDKNGSFSLYENRASGYCIIVICKDRDRSLNVWWKKISRLGNKVIIASIWSMDYITVHIIWRIFTGITFPLLFTLDFLFFFLKFIEKIKKPCSEWHMTLLSNGAHGMNTGHWLTLSDT